ncbi:hypothetical protein FV232_00975 [Methylobacterium sp. WL30]|uniref:hypothetical protein n=1 Tax=unclassified Methylobacterium TaxID=2615210 RepID=UPI0011CAEBDA|nr:MULTISPECIES: hypothetical protein [unclassified Methylobacterium]TXN38972.1 hypothetical protein FV225_11625 [Methylobacterium sp. WL93]TXN52259.1 hypothetical protein FV227_04195 [Methylobacterium sp. WL119]TXN70658.1 hypothetical protein FV232_00975 [Methylobacterium sp. WL30]
MTARRSVDPEREQVRGSPLRAVDLDWLRGQGLTGCLTAWGPAHRFDVLLRDRVAFMRGRRFEFLRHLQGEDVERVVAYTLLARDAGGAPLDVVAWHPRTGRVATWLGRTGLLGLEHPCPATADDPLIVFPDPLTWLAGSRRGVVVVDERLARPDLLEAGSIQAADIAHGAKLKAMLERVRLPRITVPTSSIRSVAA